MSSEKLHIVCPHCDAINRVPSDRLKEQPTCGKCTMALFTGKPFELDSVRFERHVTRNDIPVLVDFWAPWCGPCRMMAPAFEDAAKTLEPEMRVVKINTEAVQDIAAKYNIRSIPTLALFSKGSEVGRQAGAMDAPRIVAWAHATANAIA